jgi:hypothetical protein
MRAVREGSRVANGCAGTAISCVCGTSWRSCGRRLRALGLDLVDSRVWVTDGRAREAAVGGGSGFLGSWVGEPKTAPVASPLLRFSLQNKRQMTKFHQPPDIAPDTSMPSRAELTTDQIKSCGSRQGLA